MANTEKPYQLNKDNIFSLGAEVAVLGSLIYLSRTDPNCIGAVMTKLSAKDFWLPEHQAIFDALCGIFIETKIADPILLRERLKRDGILEQVGGTDKYLIEIVESVTNAANLDYFIRIVQDKAENRKLIAFSEAIEVLVNRNGKSDEKKEEILSLVSKMRDKQKTKGVHVKDIIEEAASKLLDKSEKGISSGFRQLDDLIGGFQAGDMNIIAGRPSMGKSAFSINMALTMGKAGKNIVIFTLEMTSIQIVQRMLLSLGRIDTINMSYGLDVRRELDDTIRLLKEYNILIVSSPSLSGDGLHLAIRNISHYKRIDCVIVDHLQRMYNKGTQQGRQQEMTEISSQIKAAALQEQVPIIVLSQLNRQVEQRQSKQPRLCDLRESGAIEQDADIVILMHRDDYYKNIQEGYEPTNLAFIQVAKNRKGRTGVFELIWVGKYVSFEEKTN